MLRMEFLFILVNIGGDVDIVDCLFIFICGEGFVFDVSEGFF